MVADGHRLTFLVMGDSLGVWLGLLSSLVVGAGPRRGEVAGGPERVLSGAWKLRGL